MDESTACTLRMSLKQGIRLKPDKINQKFKMCKKGCWKDCLVVLKACLKILLNLQT